MTSAQQNGTTKASDFRLEEQKGRPKRPRSTKKIMDRLELRREIP